jgi:hypothetical protein
MTISQERYRKDNSGADQKLPPAEETAPEPLDEAIDHVNRALGNAMQEGDVFIISGANSQPFPVATRTVGEVRAMLQYVMNIGPGAIALVNGAAVAPDHILQQDDMLEFTKEGGEKGGSRLPH